MIVSKKQSHKKSIDEIERLLLIAIEDILYEVQYAKLGSKTKVRKDWAKFLLQALKRGRL